MIRRPPRSTLDRSSAASDVYKRQSECSAPAGSVRETNVYTWLGRAQAAYANVELLDLNALVCMDGRCNAERGGRIIYRDGTHLSAAFVATLADAIAGIMTNTGNGS